MALNNASVPCASQRLGQAELGEEADAIVETAMEDTVDPDGVPAVLAIRATQGSNHGGGRFGGDICQTGEGGGGEGVGGGTEGRSEALKIWDEEDSSKANVMGSSPTEVPAVDAEVAVFGPTERSARAELKVTDIIHRAGLK